MRKKLTILRASRQSEAVNIMLDVCQETKVINESMEHIHFQHSILIVTLQDLRIPWFNLRISCTEYLSYDVLPVANPGRGARPPP